MKPTEIDLSYFVFREWLDTRRDPMDIMEDYGLPGGGYGIGKYLRFWARLAEEELRLYEEPVGIVIREYGRDDMKGAKSGVVVSWNQGISDARKSADMSMLELLGWRFDGEKYIRVKSKRPKRRTR